MDRRSFLKHAAIASLLPAGEVLAGPTAAAGRVVLVKTDDRATGVARAIDLLGLPGFAGVEVFLKANYNSSDPTPGSTHPEVLAALLGALRKMGAGAVTLGERSGMGDTRAVLRTRGALDIAGRYVLAGFVAAGLVTPGLLPFGVVDLTGGTWTWRQASA